MGEVEQKNVILGHHSSSSSTHAAVTARHTLQGYSHINICSFDSAYQFPCHSIGPPDLPHARGNISSHGPCCGKDGGLGRTCVFLALAMRHARAATVVGDFATRPQAKRSSRGNWLCTIPTARRLHIDACLSAVFIYRAVE